MSKYLTALRFLSLALGLLLSGGATFAGSATWLTFPGSGDWNALGNWSPATVPNSAADTATFNSSNTTALSLSSNTAGERHQLQLHRRLYSLYHHHPSRSRTDHQRCGRREQFRGHPEIPDHRQRRLHRTDAVLEQRQRGHAHPLRQLRRPVQRRVRRRYLVQKQQRRRIMPRSPTSAVKRAARAAAP